MHLLKFGDLQGVKFTGFERISLHLKSRFWIQLCWFLCPGWSWTVRMRGNAAANGRRFPRTSHRSGSSRVDGGQSGGCAKRPCPVRKQKTSLQIDSSSLNSNDVPYSSSWKCSAISSARFCLRSSESMCLICGLNSISLLISRKPERSNSLLLFVDG